MRMLIILSFISTMTWANRNERACFIDFNSEDFSVKIKQGSWESYSEWNKELKSYPMIRDKDNIDSEALISIIKKAQSDRDQLIRSGKCEKSDYDSYALCRKTSGGVKLGMANFKFQNKEGGDKVIKAMKQLGLCGLSQENQSISDQITFQKQTIQGNIGITGAESNSAGLPFGGGYNASMKYDLGQYTIPGLTARGPGVSAVRGLPLDMNGSAGIRLIQQDGDSESLDVLSSHLKSPTLKSISHDVKERTGILEVGIKANPFGIAFNHETNKITGLKINGAYIEMVNAKGELGIDINGNEITLCAEGSAAMIVDEGMKSQDIKVNGHAFKVHYGACAGFKNKKVDIMLSASRDRYQMGNDSRDVTDTQTKARIDIMFTGKPKKQHKDRIGVFGAFTHSQANIYDHYRDEDMKREGITVDAGFTIVHDWLAGIGR